MSVQQESASKLSDQVKTIEIQNEQLIEVFGEFMSTIRVNWLRGTLRTQSKESDTSFEETLDAFESGFIRIKRGEFKRRKET